MKLDEDWSSELTETEIGSLLEQLQHGKKQTWNEETDLPNEF